MICLLPHLCACPLCSYSSWLLLCNKSPPNCMLRTINIHYLTQFLWIRNLGADQLGRSGCSPWGFSLRSGFSWSCSQDVIWGCRYLKAWLGLQGLLPMGQTDTLDKWMLIVGRRSQFFSTGSSPYEYLMSSWHGSWHSPRLSDPRKSWVTHDRSCNVFLPWTWKSHTIISKIS